MTIMMYQYVKSADKKTIKQIKFLTKIKILMSLTCKMTLMKTMFNYTASSIEISSITKKNRNS